MYVFLRAEERAGEATDLATEPLPTPGEKLVLLLDAALLP